MGAPAPAPMVVSAELAAQLATRCSHPNLVRILGVHHSAGAAQLMIEHVPGRTLEALLDAAHEPLPVVEALTIARDLARGLFFIHQLQDGKGRSFGLVHGGLTPAHVVVGYDGVTRLAGLERLAATGGKPPPARDYAPPEQMLDPELLDRRIDTFALGAILLRALTGLRLVDSALPVPSSADIPRCPATFEQVLRKALARDPARRFDSAEAMRAAIEGFAVRDGRPLDNLEVGKLVRRLLPEAKVDLDARVIPPRPDRSMWTQEADRWVPLDARLHGDDRDRANDHAPPVRAEALRVRIAEPNPLVPAATAGATTMSVTALTDDGAAPLSADAAAVLDALGVDAGSNPYPPPGGYLAQPPLGGPGYPSPAHLPTMVPYPAPAPAAYPPGPPGLRPIQLPAPPAVDHFRWLPTRSVAGTVALLLFLFASALAIAYLASG